MSSFKCYAIRQFTYGHMISEMLVVACFPEEIRLSIDTCRMTPLTVTYHDNTQLNGQFHETTALTALDGEQTLRALQTRPRSLVGKDRFSLLLAVD